MNGLSHDLEYHFDGELASCRTCGAAEGELLTWCPGYKLNREAREACYTGNVVDFGWVRDRAVAE